VKVPGYSQRKRLNNSSIFNQVTTVRAFHFVVNPPLPSDIYLGYLPLAHILELLSEFTMIVQGIPVGYSSPNTMIDKSTKVSTLRVQLCKTFYVYTLLMFVISLCFYPAKHFQLSLKYVGEESSLHKSGTIERCIKLDYFSLASLSSLVLRLQVRFRPLP
jgi:hypothetical protein